MSYLSINPATEEVLAEYPLLSDAQIEPLVEECFKAQKELKTLSVRERCDLLRDISFYLREHLEDLAVLMTSEMGKPIKQSRAEVEKCAWLCNYFAEKGEEFLAVKEEEGALKSNYVRKDPLGIILAVMPWNFPFWQVFRCAVPSILAGNTVLLKHSSNVGQTALKIEEIFRESSGKSGLLKNLFISHRQIKGVINDKRVKAVSLTGSVLAGRAVALLAAEALKPVVLELGGSDPFIVCEDADIKAAAETAAVARCQNSGQSCIAAKRFIVHKKVFEDFALYFVEAVKKLKVGDPLSEDTDIGPIARKDLRDELVENLKRGETEGGEVLYKGEVLFHKGYYFAPVILRLKSVNNILWQEEIFGPIAPLLSYEDDQEALLLANNTKFGLGANVWSSSAKRAKFFSENLEAGLVFINSYVKSDPRLPFGGVKESGYGRELSVYGLNELVNIKTVCSELEGIF
ncbi:MAG: aldehyde dehydrogenase family protein [Candidatus Dadabacteria bacterium]|nr:MAG: aldehyde dehydrogenase family protein [Candidatus Dadabacteria bacterium]